MDSADSVVLLLLSYAALSLGTASAIVIAMVRFTSVVDVLRKLRLSATGRMGYSRRRPGTLASSSYVQAPQMLMTANTVCTPASVCFKPPFPPQQAVTPDPLTHLLLAANLRPRTLSPVVPIPLPALVGWLPSFCNFGCEASESEVLQTSRFCLRTPDMFLF